MISFFKFQGRDISALTLGLMTNIDVKHESEKLKLYTKAYDFGINSFDSSPNYQNGYSDVFLGKLVKQIGRENVFISNKVFFANPYSDFSNTRGAYLIETGVGDRWIQKALSDSKSNRKFGAEPSGHVVLQRNIGTKSCYWGDGVFTMIEFLRLIYKKRGKPWNL